MTSEALSHQSGSSTVISTIIEHPYLSALVFLTFCCIITRIRTGLQVQYNNLDAGQGQPRSVPVLPYWFPWLGHTIPFGIWFQGYLRSTAKKTPSGIYGLKIGGATHNIIVSPSLSKEIHNKPSLPITVDPIIWRFLNLAFGDNGYHDTWSQEKPEEIQRLTKIIHLMMRDPILGEANKRIVELTESYSWNLVSGNPSWVDHVHWERSGQVEITSSQSKYSTFVAEADLYHLLRDFVGNIATETLMGHAFIENNPTVFNDLWTFDSKLLTLMMGLPRWLVPSLNPAIAARERLIEAVREHHRALMDTLEGKDPGYRYSDVSDVSPLIWERVKGFHDAKTPPRIYGLGDLTIYWALNVNANLIIFWVLFYVYRDPTLLAKIRDEISPYVRLTQPESNLPIKEAPRLKIELDELMTKCPHLKGVFFETMRLEVAASSYRIVTEDFVLAESKEDALKVGKSYPDRYAIKKDELICIPLQVQHSHPVWFPSPEKFDYARHWVRSVDEKGEEHVSVEYGNTRPWGGGKTSCKGRFIAEREVMSISAAIIFLWDMEPIGKNGWKHPGDLTTVGTCQPKEDIRVRMWRRKS